jgi:hypothetical protein
VRKGFEDGLYAAVPYGKAQLIVLYNGEQLEVVSTPKQAKDFIVNHKTGTLEDTKPIQPSRVKANKSIENERGRKKSTSTTSRAKMGSRPTKTKSSTSSTRKKTSLS